MIIIIIIITHILLTAFGTRGAEVTRTLEVSRGIWSATAPSATVSVSGHPSSCSEIHPSVVATVTGGEEGTHHQEKKAGRDGWASNLRPCLSGSNCTVLLQARPSRRRIPVHCGRDH